MKKTSPSKIRKSPIGEPAEVVRKGKLAVSDEPKKSGTKTLQEFKQDEQEEAVPKDVHGVAGKRMRLATVEQEVVGSNFSRSDWYRPDWLLPETGQIMTVSLFFPSVNCAIDYPSSEEEGKLKAAAFKKLKIPYVAVLAGVPLNVDDARRMLLEQGARIAA